MRSEIDPSGQPGNGESTPTEPERSLIEKVRRAQIIEAAIDVIAVRGFAKASMAQIAERAGVSKGVISYHFAGKNELIERTVEQIYDGLGAFVASRLAGEGETGTAAWLRIYIGSLAEHMADHRTQLIALGEIFTQFRTENGELRYGIASSESLFAHLEEVFRAGQQRGELRAFDARVMAVSLQAAIDDMFAYWSVHPDHDLAAHARELTDLFWHATRAEGRADS
ncbi:TetR family transcriptional regulator [Streptomyces noursei]|uniref:TetR/AcrR family transcriptional regulator n=1 Tax=Streptomyces noursei TaxID=1971 RepID=UPI00167A0719|nr:TetR/AcrR family transcriptional regulator [Streptomyces noursei]MCZ1013224.1 TetR/AcrR family transcriptional regulator [Streptomyces noursei]GGX27904.1 TetR family transcriptional regulator [Streptomyces noursei]